MATPRERTFGPDEMAGGPCHFLPVKVENIQHES
jgi:hypothetical protein